MVKLVRDLELASKVVFVRVDFNVPLDDRRHITDDTRIRAALPTIRHALECGARVVLASHLGRPKGKRNPALSLEPAGVRLSELLQQAVTLADDCVGDGVKKNIKDLRDGQVLLLENLRFHKQETDNDEAFARALADGIDVYVNDAFGAAHRAHASTEGMVRHVPLKGAGLLLQRELLHLTALREQAARPFVAVVGGAKVSDKIGVLHALAERTQAICVGGAMAYTLLQAKGISVGASRVEKEALSTAEQFIASAQVRQVAVHLPTDHVVAAEFSDKAVPHVVTDIPEDAMGLDIGPVTQSRFAEVIRGAKTVFWNGPMGVFEWSSFSAGTQAVAQAVAETQAMTVVGGGDSVAALEQAGLSSKVSHVSTGGGASLELLEGRTLPGVAALQ